MRCPNIILATCLTVTDNMRLLPCLQSFCLECLRGAVEVAAGGDIACALSLCKVRELLD